jgi:hypothetical protein
MGFIPGWRSPILGGMPFSVLALFVGGVIVALLVGWKLGELRRRSFMEFAVTHGFTYLPHDPSILGRPFQLFTKGDKRGVENVFSGRWNGASILAFDYWCTDEHANAQGNRTSTTTRFSCVIADVEQAAFPPLVIARETVLSRLAAGLGFRDIEFESPEFNRRMRVRGKDRRFAYAFIDTSMMEFLLAAGGRSSFEAVGPWLLVYEKGRRPPQGFLPLLELATAFRDRVPRAALSLYGHG